MGTRDLRELDNKICSIMYEYKRLKSKTDEELGKKMDMTAGSIRNMRSQKRAYDLPIRKVLMLCEAAGYEVRIVRKSE